MYCIRIKTNHRLDEYRQGDRTNIGVKLKNGCVRFYAWSGFCLEVAHPVKLQVHSFTIESAWNPRSRQSKLPQWSELAENEYLLGSYEDGFVYTVLPFRVLT